MAFSALCPGLGSVRLGAFVNGCVIGVMFWLSLGIALATSHSIANFAPCFLIWVFSVSKAYNDAVIANRKRDSSEAWENGRKIGHRHGYDQGYQQAIRNVNGLVRDINTANVTGRQFQEKRKYTPKEEKDNEWHQER